MIRARRSPVFHSATSRLEGVAVVGGGRWDTTHSVVEVQGKILLVKTLGIDQEVTKTGYRPVPNLDLAGAVECLLNASTRKKGNVARRRPGLARNHPWRRESSRTCVL